MFDERSPRWINIYRGVVIALLFVFFATGLFFGLYDEINLVTPISEIPTLAIFSWTIAGALVGYAQLACNMLVIQLLDNANAIRTMTEKSKQ